MAALDEQPDNQIILSVVIPCYNQGEFILDALSSVQSCREPVYEVIIVNDGSTEALTIKVLNYLKSKGYFILEQENQGLAAARNEGIKLAKGQYILPLDADNKIRADYITKGIEILDKYPDVGIVYGDAELFGDKTGRWNVAEFDVNLLVMGNFIDACAVIRKQVWADCAGYDSQIPDKLGYEDWDFWLGAVEAGWKFYHIPEVLFDYRFRQDSMVSRCNIPENRRQLIRYIYAKHIDLFVTNFIEVAAEKEYAFLTQEAYALGWQLRCQQLEAEKKELLEVKISTENQLSQQLATLETQLSQRETELQTCQQTCQTLVQQTEAEVIHLKTVLQEAQTSKQRVEAEYEECQQDLAATMSQLKQTENSLGQKISDFEFQKAELEQAKNLLGAMETSKFWRLRTGWFKLKKMVRMGKDV